MNNLKLNDTPVRTSRNFNINNIKLMDVDIPEIIDDFNNLEIIGEESQVQNNANINKSKLIYGLGTELEKLNEKSNKDLKIELDSTDEKEIQLNFKFDDNNLTLLENIEIIANENSKSTVILKYISTNKEKAFHNGIIRVKAKKNSEIKIIIVNLINEESNNFISIENNIEENAKCKYIMVDFGGKNSITNYYSNLIGESSENIINTIYLGKENQLLDLNYIGELRGKKSNIDIDVQGALKDNAKKHFKGTIDFKKGSKKSKGNENEFCLLLSETARSMALPMLLCTEEDVEGNHSCATGKADNKQLFYIMSRGFSYKEAMKLIVRARFNKIIEQIDNEKLRNEILQEMNEKLD